MDGEKELRDRCIVCTNMDGDSFVGVKADSDDAAIYFPLGYHLPDDDETLRIDVQNLFNVLARYKKEDTVIEAPKFIAPRTVDFPIHAYLYVITSFLRSGGKYYVESDPTYRTASRGYTSWPRTVREQRALIQKNGSLVFTQMTVRHSEPNVNKDITRIHRYCVYEAFDKLGWLYIKNMPQKPGAHPNVKQSISILRSKLASSHNDNEQALFNAMISMLDFQDRKNEERQYFFGTDNFHEVWEKMIDKAFGVDNKQDYFPRAYWLMDYGPEKGKKKNPLIIDSIMVYNDKYYVLDAKYYKYGKTGIISDLPGTSDINKQITYAQYINSVKNVPEENLYNAFIMPFDMSENRYGINDVVGKVGEAGGDWIDNPKRFERIQGILIDVRTLMFRYALGWEEGKKQLADCIKKGFD